MKYWIIFCKSYILLHNVSDIFVSTYRFKCFCCNEKERYGTVIGSICLSRFLCAGTTFTFPHSRGKRGITRFYDLNTFHIIAMGDCKESHQKVLPSKPLSDHSHEFYLGQGFWFSLEYQHLRSELLIVTHMLSFFKMF